MSGAVRRARCGAGAAGDLGHLDELRALIFDAGIGPLARLARFLDASIAAHATELDARGRPGRLQEGHGDLRAEHVLLAPELSVVDCVEFDPGLRTLDTADELSFVAMDLLRLGAEPLAHEILGAYRRAGGDCGPGGLGWTFAVHRALVRAKVALMRARQLGRPAIDDAPTVEELRVADRRAWRARSIDALIVWGGPPLGSRRWRALSAHGLR